MATNPNQNEYYQNSKSDIKLSAWEYNDLVDAVMDDRLSASGLIKFKNLYTANSMSNLVICTFMVPPAYLLARWLQGKKFVIQALPIEEWHLQDSPF